MNKPVSAQGREWEQEVQQQTGSYHKLRVHFKSLAGDQDLKRVEFLRYFPLSLPHVIFTARLSLGSYSFHNCYLFVLEITSLGWQVHRRDGSPFSLLALPHTLLLLLPGSVQLYSTRMCSKCMCSLCAILPAQTLLSQAHHCPYAFLSSTTFCT